MFSEFLSQNILWVGAFMLVANLWLWSLLQGRVAGVSYVSALELPALQRGGKSVIIDVNEAQQFSSSHIPDAKNFPLSSLGEQNSKLAKLKNHTAVIVCQTGGKSAKAAKLLKQQGFEDLHILRGGMMSWTKENLPTTSA